MSTLVVSESPPPPLPELQKALAVVARAAFLDEKWSPEEFKDASPWFGPNEFGQHTTGPSFYFLQDPSEWDYWKVARYTAVGTRVTWGVTWDAWNNTFKFKFPGKDDNIVKMKNEQLDKHFVNVKYYEAFRKATGYDREMGESIVVLHRMGETRESLQRIANKKMPVIRYEAISYLDYKIDYTETFGAPHLYRISFKGEHGNKATITVHPSHCIRVKTNDIDYDQYRGQPVLKPIFSDILVLTYIQRSGGNMINRFGTGKPVISVPGLKNPTDVARVKTLIGNITMQDWIIKPLEVQMEMLNAAVSQFDLTLFANFYYNNVSMVTEIPRTILMGENLGVYGGEVPQAEYFATIDTLHGRLEEFMRDGNDLDPVIAEILGDDVYEYDWGLRHVMSQQEEVEYHAKVLTNMGQAVGVGFSCNAILHMGKFPAMEEMYKDADKDVWKELFRDITPEQMGNLPMKFFLQMCDYAIEQFRMVDTAELNVPEGEGEQPGSAGGKAKPPVPAKGQLENKMQGNNVPQKPEPKTDMPDNEKRRQKYSDQELSEEELEIAGMLDGIADAFVKCDETPGMRSKVVNGLSDVASQNTIYKFLNWATAHANKK